MPNPNSARLLELADALEEVESALAYISAGESDEDAARTLADNEVLGRVAKKCREAAQADG